VLSHGFGFLGLSRTFLPRRVQELILPFVLNVKLKKAVGAMESDRDSFAPGWGGK
jgi:hypothetical protein